MVLVSRSFHKFHKHTSLYNTNVTFLVQLVRGLFTLLMDTHPSRQTTNGSGQLKWQPNTLPVLHSQLVRTVSTE